MTKYLLQKEQMEIQLLLERIEKILYKPNTKEIEKQLTKIIRNNKDATIEETINNFSNQLIEKMTPLLKNHLTLGLQYGIKNDYFTIINYGGLRRYQNNLIPIEENTLFSFDSISKIMTAIIAMINQRNHTFNLNTKIKEINPEYQLDSTIESILKFTAYIRTEKRIDNLSTKETIELLKKCKENIEEKQKLKNFYEYNDIGFMIVRQIIPNFLEELDQLLIEISKDNLTYTPTTNTTGGKINEENITPDAKGRGIPFPGHTGLYGNIEGLLTLYDTLIHTQKILTNEEKQQLYKQPYEEPNMWKNNIRTTSYIAKIAGIYREPDGITADYDKLALFDIPNNTTKNATVTTGTCGSWAITDNLNHQFGKYTAGLLTNPYSFIENKEYENDKNSIPNTPLEVNQKGKIIGYSRILNDYKKELTTYAIILELLTKYIQLTEQPKQLKLTKKIETN